MDDEHLLIGDVSLGGTHIPKGTDEGLPVPGVDGSLGPGGTGGPLDGSARLLGGSPGAAVEPEMGTDERSKHACDPSPRSP